MRSSTDPLELFLDKSRRRELRSDLHFLHQQLEAVKTVTRVFALYALDKVIYSVLTSLNSYCSVYLAKLTAIRLKVDKYPSLLSDNQDCLSKHTLIRLLYSLCPKKNETILHCDRDKGARF